MSTLELLQGLLMKEYRLSLEQVGPEALLATVGVDSLGMIETMLQLEERFGITVPDDTPPLMATVGDLAIYVDTLLAANAPVTHPVAAAAVIPVP